MPLCQEIYHQSHPHIVVPCLLPRHVQLDQLRHPIRRQEVNYFRSSGVQLGGGCFDLWKDKLNTFCNIVCLGLQI
ncbi:hypothetical protein BDR03DRAFT_947785 [Suillus americanus]|nr:hypothetical protein BDR03DRAFT_947785 [Suillus americanus]